MIEDCFEKWYRETANPISDILEYDMFEAYEAGWKRALEVEDALTLLTELAQKDGEYD